ncbi:MAG: hypothetical protein IKF37_02900, partial [Bacilli bacterium]|nr:hypothetical protein [Bacilli bacterium]
NLNVKKYYEKTLYNVLLKETETGGLARKYTGEHHDSFIEEPSKDIYHWYARNDNEGRQVLDKNNVIFADLCWQMIRTTDTGGVKLVYNGKPELSYDNNNIIYDCSTNRSNQIGYTDLTTQVLDTTYYYGTDYNYDSNTGLFSLAGDISTGSIDNGTYTCKSTSATGTCSSGNFYLIYELKDGTTYNVYPLVSDNPPEFIGHSKYISGVDSLADAGYMYNKRYPKQQRAMHINDNIIVRNSRNGSATYYYADSFIWDEVNLKYTLVNSDSSPVNSGRYADIYSSVPGNYMCSGNSTCTSIVYIQYTDATYYYGISISDGNDYDDYSIVVGDDYSFDNGIYTLLNPTTVYKYDWYSNHSSYHGKYMCQNKTDTSCSVLYYIDNSTNYQSSSYATSSNFKYSTSFDYVYDSNTDSYKYVLDNDSVVQEWILNANILSNHHYTCFNDTGECSELYYIFRGVETPRYITLEDGKSVEDAKVEMLSADNVNSYNSLAKSMIDTWYSKNLLDYSDYLEDTIFCNSRDIVTPYGWDPNGGNVNGGFTTFSGYSVNNSFACTNETDKFSINNPKARLTYPVGLTTHSEIALQYSQAIRKCSKAYWLMSAHFYGDYNHMRIVAATGGLHYAAIGYSNFLRPTISLKPGTKYSSGDGSVINPFMIEFN